MRGMKVKFFAEFKTADGKQHWAIHSYDNASGTVSMMKDYKFEDFHPMNMDVAVENQPYGKFFVLGKSSGRFDIIDRTSDSIVATLYDLAEANDFCDFKNGNDLYREAFED